MQSYKSNEPKFDSHTHDGAQTIFWLNYQGLISRGRDGMVYGIFNRHSSMVCSMVEITHFLDEPGIKNTLSDFPII